METFSRGRRLDWQSKPGTEAAVASRQNSNIKWTQKDVALDDYRRGNMASHKELRELMLICYADNMLSDEELLVLWEILACNNNNHNNVIPVFLR